MKNIKKILFCIIGFTFLLVLFFNRNQSEIKTKSSSEDSVSKKIDNIIENMTIEEKIGQMIIINYNVSEVNQELSSILSEVKPGGFILMQDNYTTFDNTKKFVSDIKSYSEYPMIISTDQEGGNVQRLQLLEDISPTYIPFMNSVGSMNDEELAYQIGSVIAEEVRTLGINVVYAPVIDVFSNIENKVIGKRSFDSNARVVSDMGISVSRGIEDNQVISTFKHFPGHGDTNTDSHTSLPIVYKTYEELKKLELVPFDDAIKSGAKMIMSAHIALPNVTGDNTPATMSKKIITDILRGDMEYRGVVISDALNMKALTDNYSDEDIYIKTIEAGVDILLMPRDARKAVETIKNNISIDRINESVKRILELKLKYLSEDNTLDRSYLGSLEHKNIIDKIN